MIGSGGPQFTGGQQFDIHGHSVSQGGQGSGGFFMPDGSINQTWITTGGGQGSGGFMGAGGGFNQTWITTGGGGQGAGGMIPGGDWSQTWSTTDGANPMNLSQAQLIQWMAANGGGQSGGSWNGIQGGGGSSGSFNISSLQQGFGGFGGAQFLELRDD